MAAASYELSKLLASVPHIPIQDLKSAFPYRDNMGIILSRSPSVEATFSDSHFLHLFTRVERVSPKQWFMNSNINIDFGILISEI
jgi:hypothetical protein